MARGGHHSSGGHSGSHHRSGSSHRSSRSYHSSGSHSYAHSGGYSRTSGGSAASYANMPPEGVVSYNGNWISDRTFHLNVNDPVVKGLDKENLLKKKDIEIVILLFITFFGIGMFGSNDFYEMVIPFFESLPMADLTFLLFDNAVYYFPIMVVIASFIIVFLLKKAEGDKKRALCQEVVKYYKQQELERRVELETQQKINNTELYTEYPNCCAPVPYGSLNCTYCGGSLIKE